MKIYFAGSIRGGRENKENFLAGIEECEKFGYVLTRHIGDKNLTQRGEKGVSNYKIFKRDLDWLYSADVAIIDVTTPSIGVGREIETARSIGTKTLCVCKKLPRSRRLSPQVSGDPKLPLRYYRDEDEMRNIIHAFMIGSGYMPKRLEKEREYS